MSCVGVYKWFGFGKPTGNDLIRGFFVYMYHQNLTQLMYSHRLHLQMMKSCLKDHRAWLKHPELDYLQKSRQYAQSHLDLAKSYLDKFLSDASNIGIVEVGVNGVFVS